MEPITEVLRGVVNGSHKKDPNNDNRYVIEAYLPVSEVTKLFDGPWANPRIGKSDESGVKSSRIAKDIITSLETNPALFHEKNNGITLIADSAKLEAHGGRPGTLVIRYSSENFLKSYRQNCDNTQQIRGLANGGTTTGAITAHLRSGENVVNSVRDAFVKIQVRCGDYGHEEVSEIVTSLNNNLTVDPFSSANYDGAFKELRNFLESDKAMYNGRHFPKVAYFFGDSGEYQIQEIVQLLALFARYSDDGETPMPEKAYTGVSGALDFWKKNKRDALRFLPLLPSIVAQKEYIIAKSRAVYNTKGSFGGLKLFDAATGLILPAPITLPLTGLKSDIRDSNAWVFPILASFQAAIDISDDGVAFWTRDPETLFQAVGPQLIRTLSDTFISTGSKLNALGRNKDVYGSLRGLVVEAMYRKKRK